MQIIETIRKNQNYLTVAVSIALALTLVLGGAIESHDLKTNTISWWPALMYTKVICVNFLIIALINRFKPFRKWFSSTLLIVAGCSLALSSYYSYDVFGDKWGYEASNYTAYAFIALTALLSVADIRFGTLFLLSGPGALVLFGNPDVHYLGLVGQIGLFVLGGWFVGFTYRTLRNEL